jgi:hypothetical protein
LVNALEAWIANDNVREYGVLDEMSLVMSRAVHDRIVEESRYSLEEGGKGLRILERETNYLLPLPVSRGAFDTYGETVKVLTGKLIQPSSRGLSAHPVPGHNPATHQTGSHTDQMGFRKRLASSTLTRRRQRYASTGARAGLTEARTGLSPSAPPTEVE